MYCDAIIEQSVKTNARRAVGMEGHQEGFQMGLGSLSLTVQTIQEIISSPGEYKSEEGQSVMIPDTLLNDLAEQSVCAGEFPGSDSFIAQTVGDVILLVSQQMSVRDLIGMFKDSDKRPTIDFPTARSAQMFLAHVINREFARNGVKNSDGTPRKVFLAGTDLGQVEPNVIGPVLGMLARTEQHCSTPLVQDAITDALLREERSGGMTAAALLLRGAVSNFAAESNPVASETCSTDEVLEVLAEAIKTPQFEFEASGIQERLNSLGEGTILP
jgi:hypothetical protein